MATMPYRITKESRKTDQKSRHNRCRYYIKKNTNRNDNLLLFEAVKIFKYVNIAVFYLTTYLIFNSR